jgi:hypothetical protein
MRLTRRGRLTVTLSVLTLVVALTTYVLTRTPAGPALGLETRPPCTLDAGGETVAEWSGAQAMTATTVAGVGTRIGATVNGVAAAVTRSLRPEPTQPVTAEAARETYRTLPDVATPPAAAVRVAEALLGYGDATLTCVVPVTEAIAALPREDPGKLGLTPRADAVREEMRAVFGKQILGGFEPRGVDSGHIDGSAHYEGRAIDIFFRPVTEENQRLGWQQAMWAVAHADRLDVATVIFDRQVWTSDRSLQGWREYRYPGGDTDDPVLLHEDHVHVDVHEGG